MTPQEFIEKFPTAEVMDGSCQDMACPNCGCREGFGIYSICQIEVTDEGAESFGDIEWNDTDKCICGECRHEATVQDFTIDGLDDFLKELS